MPAIAAIIIKSTVWWRGNGGNWWKNFFFLDVGVIWKFEIRVGHGVVLRREHVSVAKHLLQFHVHGHWAATGYWKAQKHKWGHLGWHDVNNGTRGSVLTQSPRVPSDLCTMGASRLRPARALGPIGDLRPLQGTPSAPPKIRWEEGPTTGGLTRRPARNIFTRMISDPITSLILSILTFCFSFFSFSFFW